MRAERRSNALREEGAFRKEKRAKPGEAKNRTILLKYTNSNGQSAVFSSSLFLKPTALYIYKVTLSVRVTKILCVARIVRESVVRVRGCFFCRVSWRSARARFCFFLCRDFCFFLDGDRVEIFSFFVFDVF